MEVLYYYLQPSLERPVYSSGKNAYICIHGRIPMCETRVTGPGISHGPKINHTGPCIPTWAQSVINMIMDHMMHHMTDCGHAHPVRLFTNQRTNNTILIGRVLS